MNDHLVVPAVSPTGLWPFDRSQFDCSPALFADERAALECLVTHLAWKARNVPQESHLQALARLLAPLQQIQAHLGVYQRFYTAPTQVILRAMQAQGTTFWSWTEEEWIEIVRAGFVQLRSLYDLKMYHTARQRLFILAYLLGPQTDFLWSLLAGLSPKALVAHLFGADVLSAAVERIYGVLRPWGYEVDPSLKTNMGTTLALVFLANHSERMEDGSFDLLERLYARAPSYHRKQLERLSRVLAHWHIIPRALPSTNEKRRVRPETIASDGIAPEWVSWCLRWHQYSDLAPHVKKAYLYRLYRAGRWLAATHPDVTTPHQWTSAIAADYVAAVQQMRVGEFGSPDWRLNKRRDPLDRTEPRALGASTREHLITTLRVFFRDLHDEPHDVPRRFDPARVFRVPRAIRTLLGPNPRDLNSALWAKLVYAALNVSEVDLPHGSTGGLLYPLELVRAVAAVWVYSGLRMDEIARLPVGCIRWQQEDVTVPESGEVLPKDAICFLGVPVNKTSGAFQKPVTPVVGRRINDWERVRAPGQVPRRDRKTGLPVYYLFSHRGKPMSRHYINQTLIPMLCRKAGLPRKDERGAITSHRARATLATLLYNAPEGLSIFELMDWLGHKTPQTTRSYARVTPTKLAASYAKADRNSRLMEVLVDTKADDNGDVKVYYVLGEHGLCGNPDWATCIYRMACIKCPYFVPHDRAQLVAASRTVKRFMELVELTDDEVHAVQDDQTKLEEAVGRTEHLSTPTTLRRRAKGAQSRGIPLTMLTVAQEGTGS